MPTTQRKTPHGATGLDEQVGDLVAAAGLEREPDDRAEIAAAR